MRPTSEETSLPSAPLREIEERLRSANQDFSRRYPGDSGRREPVHVVYGGAHLFKRNTVEKLGTLALRSFEEHAADAEELARVFEVPEPLASAVHARISEKLQSEPVEDYRIDFEDGYGLRSDEEEDGHALTAAREMAAARDAGALPPFCGFRIKSLFEETRNRAIRTLGLFLTTLGQLPEGFLITLPKVTSPEQVKALADLFDLLETTLEIHQGSLRMEIMVETPQSVLGLLPMVEAARGRCAAAHLGVYDYAAALGIPASNQEMRHPASDFARHLMQASLAGTGVRISDGATNVLPIQGNVHVPWKIHYENVRRALVLGFYQGWDLHPAQLVPRYAAVYGFFLEGLDQAAERLRNFVDKAARATRVREVFDDAATGQGLLNFFLRAVYCGAISEDEAVAQSGLTLEELRGRSFGKILEGRR